MPQSAITILTKDHRAVEKLFAAFEKHTDRAVKTRSNVVAQIIRELSIHASVEEQVFYPRLREEGKKLKDEVLEALEEHHAMKTILAELEGMDGTEQRFAARVTVLIEQVKHHVAEEESELFPRAKKALTAKQLQELGGAIEAARLTAPTHAHPNAPDDRFFGLSTTMVAGVDAARDAGHAAIETTGQVVRRAKKAVAKGR